MEKHRLLNLGGDRQKNIATDIESFKEALTLPVLTLADIPDSEMKQERNRERSNNISHDQLMAELGLSQASPTS